MDGGTRLFPEDALQRRPLAAIAKERRMGPATVYKRHRFNV
jgi:hypothetical protein